MSDRIAVFNQGRIEQVGAPAEIYERPATPFVAGFVGTSNLLEGESAQQVVGASGTYSIRPEKIRVLKESAEADEPEHSTATGTVVEVVYLGDASRFLVDLDAGGRLTALRQNLETSSEDVAAYRGTRVPAPVSTPSHTFKVPAPADDPHARPPHVWSTSCVPTEPSAPLFSRSPPSRCSSPRPPAGRPTRAPPRPPASTPTSRRSKLGKTEGAGQPGRLGPVASRTAPTTQGRLGERLEKAAVRSTPRSPPAPTRWSS